MVSVRLSSRKLLWLILGGGILVLAAWGVYRQRHWPLVNAPPAAVGPVLCFGDSLVAGDGTDTPAESYPALLAGMLGRPTIAAGVSGETAVEGWARLQANLDLTGAIVIVTLGGNDILQRRPWTETSQALRHIFGEFQHRGAMVVYTGVEPPFPGTGLRGRQRQLCRDCGVLFVPDILGDILARPGLKADQIHPNAAGYREFARRVADALRFSL